MENKKRVFTVLCIDGGGVRGIIPARILQEIEERTGKPICELFDLIGGPSTGSIVAAGLSVPDPDEPSKPKYTAEEMKNFYHKQTPAIFPEMRFKMIRQVSNGTLYDPKPLEDALLKAFGDYKMKDALTSLMIPATDIKNFRPVWINAFKGRKDTSPEGWGSMLLRDAVRASTTAPTYFPAKRYYTTPNENMPNVTHRHALIDGGFFAGSTLHRLLAEAKKLAPPDADIVFVHLGTGSMDNSLSPEEFNKLGPLGMVSKSKGSILMSLVVNLSVTDAVEQLGTDMGANFIDIDGKIPLSEGSIPLDSATEKNLHRLESFAERLLQNKASEVDRLCAILKEKSGADLSFKDSQQAYDQLAEKLESQKGLRGLMKLYRKILVPDANDTEFKPLTDRLNDVHKKQLEQLYNDRQIQLAKTGGISGVFREVSDDVNKFFRKLGGRDNDAPPPANDDKQTPPPAQKKKRRGRGFGLS
jgi:predicted acylesterase/phospholipase RssA